MNTSASCYHMVGLLGIFFDFRELGDGKQLWFEFSEMNW